MGENTYSYDDNNQLLAVGDTSYNYDINGNTLGITTGNDVTEFQYDYGNRLTKISKNSTEAFYYYDPFGRRLSKEVNGKRTWFHYADEGLVAEFDASGNLAKSYSYEPDSLFSTNPIMMSQQDSHYFYHNDHLGAPHHLTDVGGKVVWSATYNAFGEVSIDQNIVTNNLRFPGQYFDEESGLYYNWHRFYDPSTGRYINADPIGLDGGMNLYSYANSNPINFIDPWGLIWVTIGYDYQGSKNWWNLIIRNITFIDEGKPLGTNPKTYEGSTRDLIQEWQHDPDNPCKDGQVPMGWTRKIRQKYVAKPDLRPEGYWSPSNHWWTPQVPNRTYKNY